MGYLEMTSRYIAITKEIGFLEKQMKRDKDLSVKRKLKDLRKEQKKLQRKLDKYNGVAL